MVWSGSVLLTCFLAVAGWSGHTFAARTPQQRREQANLYPVLPPASSPDPISKSPTKDFGEREFSLRHVYHHGAQKYPRLHRYIDLPTDAEYQVTSDYGKTFERAPTRLRVKAASLVVQRMAKRKPADIDHLLAYSAIHGEPPTLPASAWTFDEIAGPNITNKETILSFAKMAANAYYQERDGGEWLPVKGGFNYTDDFGWEDDGLRGHIFVDEKNQTIVIGLKGTSLPYPLGRLGVNISKGTSPAIFDGADTTGNDKLNDNLFGSCCCGQGGPLTWKGVCSCMTSAYTCNQTCVRESLKEKSRYYWAVQDLYYNVTDRYPNADVWLSGHSLGGVVSALLGLSHGLPTVTFEAFPDAMAAFRLGLPTPPNYKIGLHQSRANTGIYHFGHTADPIFMGSCNSATSFCTLAGYAFQGLCHTGQTCTFDTVGDFGWRVGIGTHKIVNVINDVLEKYDHVPGCEEDLDCTDCSNWKFFENNGSEPITSTSSSSSSTRTRTATCKTPGWWGCLDETTTTTGTSTTTTSTSTSTCKTPGWFGCNDPTTTTTASTSKRVSTPSSAAVPSITTTSSTLSTSCKTPGWLGCNDSTTVAPKPSSTVVQSTPTPTSSLPSPSRTPSTRRKCIARYWYGFCKDWQQEYKSEL